MKTLSTKVCEVLSGLENFCLTLSSKSVCLHFAEPFNHISWLTGADTSQPQWEHNGFSLYSFFKRRSKNSVEIVLC